MIGSKLNFFIAITLLCSLLKAQDIKVTATVDKNPVPLSDQFVYQVELSGSVQNLPDVSLPDFSDFRVTGGPSSSSSIQIVNFNISASRTYSVVLMPRKVGSFKISAATVQFKGQTYSSDPVEVTVTQAAAAPQTQPPLAKQDNTSDVDVSQLVFLRAVPSQKSAYVNEEVTVQYKIYFRVNISGNDVLKLPEAVGCWVEEYPSPRRPQIYTETVNGVRYNVAEIKKVAVFPSRAGKITISPLNMIVELVVPRQRPRGPSSLFDDFFSDPFSQTVKKSISSGALELNVLPLSEQGRPDNFSGLVGNFKVESSLDKKTAITNEALSYKVKIAGTGLLKFLNTLPVEFSSDFEVYDPKINESLNKNGKSITSSKEFEYVIIPRVAGEQKIKATSISIFNPDRKTYQVLHIPEYNIIVSKGKDIAYTPGSGSVFSKEEVQLLGQDIRFIKDNPGDFHPVGSMPFKSWWFYLSFILPVIIFGAALAYRSHLDKMSTNVVYARGRRAQKMAQRRLSEAKNFWRNNQPVQFYGAVSSCLTGYLADKNNKSAAGMLRHEIEKLLSKSEVANGLKEDYLNCLDEADFRRFAPGASSEVTMKEFYQEAEKLLIQLEKYF